MFILRRDGVVAALPVRPVLSEDGRVKSNGWKDGSMTYDTMIGIDLAKNVFVRPASRMSFCLTGGDIA